MSNRRLRLSVVIPAYNEAEFIAACLTSLLNQTIAPYEIIVVNNKSSDQTCDIVKKFQAQYPAANIQLLHQSVEQGITATRNFGFNHVTGDIIGRFDADSLLEPDWVEVVTKVFSDPSVVAITGPLSYHDMPFRRFGLRGDHRIRKGMSIIDPRYQLLCGANMALRTELWQEVGPKVCTRTSDHRFKNVDDQIHEDLDLSVHVSECGYRVRYVPDMVVNTSARRLKLTPKQFRHYTMRYYRTYARHNVTRFTVRIPILIYLSTYFPFKMIQKLYERGGIKRDTLTMSELRDIDDN